MARLPRLIGGNDDIVSAGKLAEDCRSTLRLAPLIRPRRDRDARLRRDA
jgi:hypothetical protein